MLNEHHYAERVTDALRPKLAVGRPRAGKRRIGHRDPWTMFSILRPESRNLKPLIATATHSDSIDTGSMLTFRGKDEL
jgi:hypothetical protein